MCYSAMIAAKARAISATQGMGYDEALQMLIWEHQHRWTGLGGRPSAPILQDDGKIALARWTFLAPWIKDDVAAAKQSFSTGNAVAEEMFEKRTFKEAARSRRGLIVLDAYYEHQHRGRVTVPYRFFRSSGESFLVGVVWTNSFDGPSFAICTMPPTKLAAYIHNNPDAPNGPRQPVIFRTFDEALTWRAGGGPETIEHILLVREDGFLVAQETRNIHGNWPKKAPAPPPGAPEGVLPPEKDEYSLF